jgi:hypothetical protein
MCLAVEIAAAYSPIMTERARLQQKLNTVEAELPCLIPEHPDPADLWPAFAGMVDDVLDFACPCAFVDFLTRSGAERHALRWAEHHGRNLPEYANGLRHNPAAR